MNFPTPLPPGRSIHPLVVVAPSLWCQESLGFLDHGLDKGDDVADVLVRLVVAGAVAGACSFPFPLPSSPARKLLVMEERASSIRRKRGKGKEHCQVTARPLLLFSLNIKLLVLEEKASSIRRKRGNWGRNTAR